MCVKGYIRKSDHTRTFQSKAESHNDKLKMVETLVFGGGGAGDKNVKNHAEWLIKTDQVAYTPLHWLAYWNDFESINFLFK
jgi:hypothetical protein